MSSPPAAPGSPAKPSPVKASVSKKQEPPPPFSPQSKRISDEVESAAEKFKTQQQRLDALAGVVKGHHGSILDLSEQRLKEARQFEILTKNTPLEGITGKTNYTPPAAGTASKRHSTKGDEDDEQQSPKKADKDAKPPVTASSTPAAGGSKTDEGGKKSPKSSGKSEKQSSSAEVDAANAFAPVVVDRVVVEKSDFTDVDPSLGGVTRAAHDLTVQYAAKHKRHISTYIEEWSKVVASKVQGRMIEFRKLQDNLKHYEKKVKELRDDLAEREEKKKKVTGKQLDKTDRNEIKLEGAQEAHDAYGETLILLLEEVTDRSWRDMFPLLTMELKFQANYYADQAKIFANLEGAAENLANIGKENDVTEGGRLKSIKVKRPEEIYTGEREMVALPKKKCAVVSAPAEKE